MDKSRKTERRKGLNDQQVSLAAHRLPLPPVNTDERDRLVRETLSRVLNMGTTVAFLGAGCSWAWKYPLWGQAVEEILKATGKTASSEPGTEASTADLLYTLEDCKDSCGDRYYQALRNVFAETRAERPDDTECLYGSPKPF